MRIIFEFDNGMKFTQDFGEQPYQATGPQLAAGTTDANNGGPAPTLGVAGAGGVTPPVAAVGAAGTAGSPPSPTPAPESGTATPSGATDAGPAPGAPAAAAATTASSAPWPVSA
jgi:hypothetical protein